MVSKAGIIVKLKLEKVASDATNIEVDATSTMLMVGKNLLSIFQEL
jgi:hypothetical protein